MRHLFTLLIASLPTTALAQSGVYDHRGAAGSEFGTAIAAIGDVDLVPDGVPDLIVGAPHARPDRGTDRARPL